MRIALISDIHGNLVALDATLQDIGAQNVAQVICLGDISFSGPQPHDCIARIRERGIPTVQGNCDDISVRLRTSAPEPAQGSSRWGAWVAEIDHWSAKSLTDDDAAYLSALPMTLSVPLGDGATLLCAHGSPQSFNHRLMPTTPEDTLAAMVGPVSSTALAVGHTHYPMRRALGTLAIVNPGSVGLPMATDANGAIYNPAEYADYGVLTWENGALDWETRRVALDAEAVHAAASASDMPHPSRWRGDWSQP